MDTEIAHFSELPAMKESAKDNETTHNKLARQWTVWGHLPHDTDWSIKSYKEVYELNTVEDTIALIESLPEVLVINCMLFIMRKGIIPVWEDVNNRKGGCFSYKIANKQVYNIWKDLTYMLVGETLSENKDFVKTITGITISPKKSFCIMKIWTSTCEYQNPNIITTNNNGLASLGCIFKKHTPEY